MISTKMWLCLTLLSIMIPQPTLAQEALRNVTPEVTSTRGFDDGGNIYADGESAIPLPSSTIPNEEISEVGNCVEAESPYYFLGPLRCLHTGPRRCPRSRLPRNPRASPRRSFRMRRRPCPSRSPHRGRPGYRLRSRVTPRRRPHCAHLSRRRRGRATRRSLPPRPRRRTRPRRLPRERPRPCQRPFLHQDPRRCPRR